MFGNTYVFIDIGTNETKLMEARVKGSSITILKITHMRDMSLFVSNVGNIQQVRGFCESLRATLKEANIKARSAIVCSNILAIMTRDITQEYASVKDCKRTFSRDYVAPEDHSVIYDWQFVGDTKIGEFIQQNIYLATAQRSILTDFVKTVKLITGLNVVSIEPSFTAQCNLRRLYNFDYDMPSVAFIDIGSTCAHCKIFKHNSLVYARDVKSLLFNCPASLSEALNKPEVTIRYLLHTVGVTSTQKSYAILSSEGVDADEYLNALKKCYETFVTDLKQVLTSVDTTLNLENIQVVVCGTYAALPGAAEFIQERYTYTPCRVLQFGSSFNSCGIIFTNKSNMTITPDFVNCLGLCLKFHNTEHIINLCPNASHRNHKELPFSQFVAKNAYNILYDAVIVFLFIIVVLVATGILTNRNTVTDDTDTSVVSQGASYYIDNDFTIAYGSSELVSIKPTSLVDEDGNNFTYSNYNENIIAVSSEGVVTPLAVGKTIVQIHKAGNAEPDFDAVVSVNVVKGKRNPKLSDVFLQLSDESAIIPFDLADGNVHIVSLNPTVVTVIHNRLYPLAVGTAAIQLSYPETPLYTAEDYTFYTTVYQDINSLVVNGELSDNIDYVYFDKTLESCSLSLRALNDGVIQSVKFDDSVETVNSSSTVINFVNADHKIFTVKVKYPNSKDIKTFTLHAIAVSFPTNLQMALVSDDKIVYTPTIDGDILTFKVPSTFISGVLIMTDVNRNVGIFDSYGQYLADGLEELTVLMPDTSHLSYNFRFNTNGSVGTGDYTINIIKED